LSFAAAFVRIRIQQVRGEMQKIPPKFWRFVVGLIVLGFLAAIVAYVRTDWSQRSIQVQDETRRYLFYAPDHFEGELPLLLVFHGFSGTAEEMRESSQLHELVNKHQFFLAYLAGNSTWHRPKPGSPNPDVEFFDQLCDHLEQQYPIDSSRIYVAGMSMGGDFAIRLAGLRSDRIAAVASQGMMTSDVVDSQRPFPLLIIVGTEDDRVPESWFPSVPDAFRERGHEVEVIRPAGVGHRWHLPLNDRLWSFLAGHRLETENRQITKR
jgi:poly(3-hydroxybutyrate) depolymerase